MPLLQLNPSFPVRRLIITFGLMVVVTLASPPCHAQDKPSLKEAQRFEAQARVLLTNPDSGNNFSEATALLRKSVDADHLPSILLLASLYENGDPNSRSDQSKIPDFPFARRLYLRAAALGEKNALTKLQSLTSPQDPPPPPAIDLQALSAKASSGDSAACNDLAELYFSIGTNEQDRAAMALFEKSALNRNIDAMLNLGVIYTNGWGVPKNLEAANLWFLHAHLAKSPAGARSQAILYLQGLVPRKTSNQIILEMHGLFIRPPSRPAFRWSASADQAWQEFDDANRLAISQDPHTHSNLLIDPRSTAYRARMLRLGINTVEGDIYGGCLRFNPQAMLASCRLAAQYSDPLAKAELGMFYAAGVGIDKDDQRAIAWFRLAAQTGDAQAMLRLAMIYAPAKDRAAYEGNGPTASFPAPPYPASLGYEGVSGTRARPSPTDPPQPEITDDMVPWNLPDAKIADAWFASARHRLELLASRGDAPSANLLGEMYATGMGVPQSHEKALTFFQTSAAAGNAAAMCNLALAYELGRAVPKDLAAALNWYEKSGDAGNALAMHGAGRIHEATRIPSAKPQTAESWHTAARQMGNAQATRHLAAIRQKKITLLTAKADQNDTDAILQLADLNSTSSDHDDWLKKAANKGNVPAMLRLHQLYNDGITFGMATIIAIDQREAEFWLTKAIGTGDPRAFVARDGKAEIEKAIPVYRKAAEAGDTDSMFALSGLLARQPLEHRKWLSAAAQRGHQRAMIQLALERLKDSPSPTNAQEAIDWLTKAYHAGSATAAETLAIFYASGTNQPINETLAIAWQIRADGTDESQAIKTIAASFERAPLKTLPQSRVHWLTKASALGSPQATAQLAECYANGKGVGEDLARAKSLYLQAANLGYKRFRELPYLFPE